VESPARVFVGTMSVLRQTLLMESIPELGSRQPKLQVPVGCAPPQPKRSKGFQKIWRPFAESAPSRKTILVCPSTQVRRRFS
jgi:hypothetical protein